LANGAGGMIGKLTELMAGKTERRWSLALALILAVLTSLAGLRVLLAPAAELKDKTWERIQQQGVMRIGMDASYPPFENIDEEGNLIGYDIDLAHELARRFGVESEFVIISFDGLYDALLVERIDLIISALPFDIRLTEDVVYSYSYFNAGQVLAVRDDEEGIVGVDNLAGRRVGVELGSMGDVEARQLLRRMEFELLLYRTPEEALTMLKEGEVEAAIMDVISTYEFIRVQGGVNIVGPPVTDDPYVIAIPLNSPILQEQVNEAILELSTSGFLDQLRMEWF
jgi:ABC-type amino acid transport substrate-binding protein